MKYPAAKKGSALHPVDVALEVSQALPNRGLSRRPLGRSAGLLDESLHLIREQSLGSVLKPRLVLGVILADQRLEHSCSMFHFVVEVQDLHRVLEAFYLAAPDPGRKLTKSSVQKNRKTETFNANHLAV